MTITKDIWSSLLRRERRSFLFVFFALALVSFTLSPSSLAQLPTPAPDGGYPGANTAEGDNALLNLTSGIANTAVGFNALADNTTGGWNVAIGSSALASNTTGSFNMAVGTDALTKNTPTTTWPSVFESAL